MLLDTKILAAWHVDVAEGFIQGVAFHKSAQHHPCCTHGKYHAKLKPCSLLQKLKQSMHLLKDQKQFTGWQTKALHILDHTGCAVATGRDQTMYFIFSKEGEQFFLKRADSLDSKCLACCGGETPADACYSVHANLLCVKHTQLLVVCYHLLTAQFQLRNLHVRAALKRGQWTGRTFLRIWKFA